jgi:hypothetical protein
LRAIWILASALVLSAPVLLGAEDAGTQPRLPTDREVARSPRPIPISPRGSPPVAPILESHPLDLGYPYGIIYDSDANDFWISDLAGNGNDLAGNPVYTGDGRNHEFSPDWTPTGRVIDVRNPGFFPMDGTYDPSTRMLWQVSGLNSVGCVFEMDPAAGVLTGRIICPPFETPQSALAYDANTDTFYSGSLDDNVISHFDSSGNILDTAEVVEHVSALVFNPSTGHLFVLHRFIVGPDVLIVDPARNYAILSEFNIEAQGVWSSGMRGWTAMETSGSCLSRRTFRSS